MGLLATKARAPKPPEPGPCRRTRRHRRRPGWRGRGHNQFDLDNIEPVLEEGNDDRLLALDEALRQLEVDDPRKAGVVKLRFFAGLTSVAHERENLNYFGSSGECVS
jgi:hypothetical protein